MSGHFEIHVGAFVLTIPHDNQEV